MEECDFCKLDKSKIYNTIIEETKNFYIKPSIGAIVEGYLLIISKRHVNCMQQLNENEKKECLEIITKYRKLFFEKYTRYPIIFEHETCKINEYNASSIIHAHIHIVNYNFKNEEDVLKNLNLLKFNGNIQKEKNYLFYMDEEANQYITYNFKPISQMMRKLIAKELEIEDKYDWRKYPFTNNITKTLDTFKIKYYKETYNNIDYYNNNAELYFNQTSKGTLQENYDRFLCKIPNNSYILDFGCGSGRDSKYFIEKGFKVKAIDGSVEMCKLASKYINQNVECMKFEELDEENVYDAIWACSSVLHAEKEELPNILNKMIRALKPNGVIYISFKKGNGYEIKDGKYYNFVTKKEIEEILNHLNYEINIIGYYETYGTIRTPNTLAWANFILKRCD